MYYIRLFPDRCRLRWRFLKKGFKSKRGCRMKIQKTRWRQSQNMPQPWLNLSIQEHSQVNIPQSWLNLSIQEHSQVNMPQPRLNLSKHAPATAKPQYTRTPVTAKPQYTRTQSGKHAPVMAKPQYTRTQSGKHAPATAKPQ